MDFSRGILFSNLLASILSLFYSNEVYIKKQPLNKINITYIREYDYKRENKRKNEFKILKGNGLKKNGVLNIRIKNNKLITFKDKIDKKDETNISYYKYIGFIPKLNFHIIQVKYYETGEYIILNAENGKKYYCWGLPNISPSGKKIFCLSGSINYDIMPNGIQIFNINKNQVTKNIEYTTDKWEPVDGYWGNDRKIMLKMIIPSSMSLSKKDEIKYSAATF